MYRYVGNNSTNATDPTGMWLNFAIGAAIGGGLDLAVQLWEQKGDFSKIDPTRLAISTVTGALGGGIGGLLAKQGVGLAARTAITAGAEFNLGYWGKVAENKITGKDDLFDGALLSGAIGGIAGAGGELLQAGAGAAWGKYGSSITSGAKSLDRWGGSALDWARNPLYQVQESFAGGIPGGWGVNSWDNNANPLSQQFMAMSDGLGERISGSIQQGLANTGINSTTFGFNSQSVNPNDLSLIASASKLVDQVGNVHTKFELMERATPVVFSGAMYRGGNVGGKNSPIHLVWYERGKTYTSFVF